VSKGELVVGGCFDLERFDFPPIVFFTSGGVLFAFEIDFLGVLEAFTPFWSLAGFGVVRLFGVVGCFGCFACLPILVTPGNVCFCFTPIYYNLGGLSAIRRYSIVADVLGQQTMLS
jgi:hypothetical protein